MSSYSSTTSSINPPKENGVRKENGGYLKSRHHARHVGNQASPEKCQHASEVNTISNMRIVILLTAVEMDSPLLQWAMAMVLFADLFE